MKNPLTVKPIGVVHSPLKTREDVIQSTIEENIGEIEIFEDYAEGLSDLKGFSHIIAVFWLHQSSFKALKVQPIYHPETLRGVFATRSPDRPNPIALTALELLTHKGNILEVKGIDILDGTPVLDIKPYTRFDQKPNATFGWLSQKKSSST